MAKPPPVTLDGHSLSIADVVAVARQHAAVALDTKALAAVAQSRKAVEAAVARGATIYGVNTGFGKLAHVRIPPEQARQPQLKPITLEAKEGLAFVNGTQAQTGLAALLVTDAWTLWRSAHAAAAMSLEAVRGSPDPFDARIHDARPHPWQQRSAALLRDLLADS